MATTLFNPTTGITATPNAGTTPQQQNLAVSQGFTPIAPNFNTPTTVQTGNIGTAPLNIPTIPPASTLVSHNLTAPAGTILDANGNATQPPAPTTPQSNRDQILSQFQTAGNTLDTKGAVTQQLQQEQQLAQKTLQATQDYNTYNKAKLDLAQQVEAARVQGGVTKEGAQQMASDIQAKGNANLANLAVQAQASQGLLSAAEKTIADKLDAQFKPVQDKIDYLTKLAALNEKDLTQKEKYQLDQKAQEVKTDLALVNGTADDIHKAILANNAPASVYSAIDKVTQDYVAGKITASQAQGQMYQAAGQYGQKKTAGTIGVDGQISPLSQSVIDNPNLLNQLTPTMKGQVITELSIAGYDTSRLGVKPLSDAAIKEINQSTTALTSLNDLKAIINTNKDLIGPISGFAAINPYSEARKVQADIDRVKQQVGKALEGGVLRKEDEEKYKKILATITDTPETAIYKVDQLIGSIQKSIDDYSALQAGAGKSSDVSSSLQKKVTSGMTGTLPSGVTYKVIK